MHVVPIEALIARPGRNGALVGVSRVTDTKRACLMERLSRRYRRPSGRPRRVVVSRGRPGGVCSVGQGWQRAMEENNARQTMCDARRDTHIFFKQTVLLTSSPPHTCADGDSASRAARGVATQVPRDALYGTCTMN